MKFFYYSNMRRGKYNVLQIKKNGYEYYYKFINDIFSKLWNNGSKYKFKSK